MYGNVPNDWNAYWRICEICGHRYHKSDGNCECTDDLEDCACGSNDWDVEYGDLVCIECGTRPGSTEK